MVLWAAAEPRLASKGVGDGEGALEVSCAAARASGKRESSESRCEDDLGAIGRRDTRGVLLQAQASPLRCVTCAQPKGQVSKRGSRSASGLIIRLGFLLEEFRTRCMRLR